MKNKEIFMFSFVFNVSVHIHAFTYFCVICNFCDVYRF